MGGAEKSLDHGSQQRKQIDRFRRNGVAFSESLIDPKENSCVLDILLFGTGTYIHRHKPQIIGDAAVCTMCVCGVCMLCASAVRLLRV